LSTNISRSFDFKTNADQIKAITAAKLN